MFELLDLRNECRNDDRRQEERVRETVERGDQHAERQVAAQVHFAQFVARPEPRLNAFPEITEMVAGGRGGDRRDRGWGVREVGHDRGGTRCIALLDCVVW